MSSILTHGANFDPGLCNGSTTDFDSVSLGSIPSPGAKLIGGSNGLRRSLARIVTRRVRFPRPPPILSL